MAEHLKKWKADNPGAQIKEGMAAVSSPVDPLLCPVDADQFV
jgi:hypothetical protein